LDCPSWGISQLIIGTAKIVSGSKLRHKMDADVIIYGKRHFDSRDGRIILRWILGINIVTLL